jgi:hypothetical protein
MSDNDLLQKLRLALGKKIQPVIDLIYASVVLMAKIYIFDFTLSPQLSLGLSVILLTAGLGLQGKIKMNIIASILELLVKDTQDDDKTGK